MPTLNELFEGVRPGLLYHGTGPDNAAAMIHSNTILGRTEHKSTLYHTVDDGQTVSTRPGEPGFRPKDINKYGNVDGVSMTRDPNFARRWTSGEGVVVVLSEVKLRQNYRLIPYNYYGNRTESEEFVVGDIKNLSRYLVSILCSEKVALELEEEDEKWIEGHKQYDLLLRHPLLRVDGHRWDAMSGKVSKAA